MTEEKTPPVALVTGASSGLGEGFARRLAGDGYDLILVARRRDRLEKLAGDLRDAHDVTVEVLCADLVDADQLSAVEDRLRAAKVNLVVNNAGFLKVKPFADGEVGTWDSMIRLHAIASVRLAHAALPAMIERNEGAIINVASIAAFFPLPANALYTATKAFLVAFTEGIRQDLAGTAVRVQALCPGWTRTEILDDPNVDDSKIGRWDTVEDVVDYSLKCLARDKLICIPGWRNRWLVRAARLTLRPILRYMLRTSRANQAQMKGE